VTATRPATARLVPPEPRQRLMVQSTDGVRLATEIHGPDDAPSVVLIHGWTCSTRTWAPVIRALRDDLRIVAYDQRGHGGSDRPEVSGYRTEALADDLAAVLAQALPAGHTAVLAGHSMGGMSIMAAASRPAVRERVAGVLLASTACSDLVALSRVVPLADRVPPLRAVMRAASGSASRMRPDRLTRAVLRYIMLGPDAPADVVALNAEITCACDRRARARWGRVLNALDLTAGLRHLDVPAGVLVGARDRLTPPPQARRLAALLPGNPAVTEVAGVGHMTPLEAPDAVAALIRMLVAGSG
jgi:pimeloyl-ACP methyl ester carboxylesterase